MMHTETYTKDEIIYERGKIRDKVVYVVRGSITILSAEDHESAILTLGMGTVLGESCLVYACNSPVQVHT